MDETYLFLIRIGLEVKINYAYEFECDTLFQDYIDFTSKQRAEADDPKVKDMFKLLGNSLYGKTCENVFNYNTIRFERTDENTDFDRFKTYTNLFHYNDDTNLILAEEKTTHVILDGSLS